MTQVRVRVRVRHLEWRNWIQNFKDFLQSHTELQIAPRHTSLLKWRLSKQLKIGNILILMIVNITNIMLTQFFLKYFWV